ncbi:MAG: hypothetical protein H6911_02990 [Rickettsiaceae bacterium]|nr:hypothetical protein [Rickettsiaceae bacterium]
MRFEQIKDESEEGFRRLTGIKRPSFDFILTILKQVEGPLKTQGGKSNKIISILGCLCFSINLSKSHFLIFKFV